MDDQSPQQPQEQQIPQPVTEQPDQTTNQAQNQQKPERIDELDVIGGILVRFVKKLFGSFKSKSSQ